MVERPRLAPLTAPTNDSGPLSGQGERAGNHTGEVTPEMVSAIVAATSSQMASAIMHLERRDEWRYVRIGGVRYVSMMSGRSNRVHLVRADGAACDCRWYALGHAICSHMAAQELAATEGDLREGYTVGAATVAKARKTYEELFGTTCEARGCQDDAQPREPGDEGAYCKRHSLAEVF